MWSRGVSCKSVRCQKTAFLVARARAEELRVTEAESWKKLSSVISSTTSGSEKNEAADQHAVLSRRLTRRCRTVMRREGREFRPRDQPDPGKLKEEVPKRLHLVTKQSRPLWMAMDTVSEQPEKRARIPETHAEVDPETFALTL